MSRTHGSEVYKTTFVRFLRCKNVIVKRTFVIVYVVGIRLLCIVGIVRILVKHFSKTEHVVSITGLRSLNVVQHGREVIRWMEMFADAISSDADGTVIDYRIPKETGGMIPFCSMIPSLVVL